MLKCSLGDIDICSTVLVGKANPAQFQIFPYLSHASKQWEGSQATAGWGSAGVRAQQHPGHPLSSTGHTGWFQQHWALLPIKDFN